MGTEIAITDSYARASLDERQRYVAALAQAGDLLPKSFMERPMPNPAGGMMPQRIAVGKVLLIAELGMSLGIHPASALQSIYVVDGKPSLSANLLAALVRRNGHKLRVSTSGSIKGGDFIARAVLIRSDDPEFEFVVEWTWERATRAGLTGKDNWKKYGEAMLKSRAITEVVREGAPDVTLFAAYAPEELGASVNEEGEPVDLQQVSASPARQVGESAPAPSQRREAPVMAEPEPEPVSADEPAFDWGKAVAGLANRAEALALHGKARAEGMLDLEVKVGRKKHNLGKLIVEVGTAFAEQEKAAAEQPEDIVEAEVVDDGPMAMGGE